MSSAIKLLALVLSLGFDTLTVSVALGLGKQARRWKTAVVFASFEALMPLVGMFAGNWLGVAIGMWASLLGALLLMGLGVYMLLFDDDDDAVAVATPLSGWALLAAGLSVSLDELAVGFSMALVDVPVGLAVVLIAVQAFLLSWLGLTFATQIKKVLGEWSEKVGGMALLAVGIWLLIEACLRIF